MEIKQYIAIVQHWLWLLILGLVLGAVAAFAFSVNQEEVYQSSTRVQVMSAPASSQTDYYYYIDAQLAGTYVQTLKTRPVLDEVGQQLGYRVNTSQITTKVVSDTQLIDIFVEDTDPQHAADIANKLVEVFAVKNNELQANRFQESETSLQGQIQTIDAQILALQTQSSAASSQQTEETMAKAEAEINRLEGEILALQSEIDVLSNPPKGNSLLTPTVSPETRAQLNEKQLRLEQLQKTYDLYQEIYTNLLVLGNSAATSNDTAEKDKLQSTLALYEQIRANLLASYEDVRLARLNSTSNIVQIEPATVNTSPVRPLTTRNVGMGAAVGLLLAAAIIFAIEYLDDTLKTSEQINELLGLPVIGYIAVMEHVKDEPYVIENPRSPVSESFRTLRTNLEFASVDQPIKTLLVVSAHPSEGKSTVAANLAVTYAQGGKHVLLIDADLRRPRVHRFFGLSNRVGLSDIFRSSMPLIDVITQWKDTNLAIVTSGGIPPNPADLLSSKRMVSTLEAAKKVADIVIVDAPPFLVADASILASHMDGVLLVVYPGKTPIDAAVTTLEQMKRAGANIVGVVMNRIPRNRAYYYGGYRYYSPYYHDQYSYYGDKPKTSKLRLVSRFRHLLGMKKKVSEGEAPTGKTSGD